MPKETPADYVIRQFGGISELARLMRKNRSTIWEWRKVKTETGRGRSGLIPSKHHRQLLKLAQRRNLDITPQDLVMGR